MNELNLLLIRKCFGKSKGNFNGRDTWLCVEKKWKKKEEEKEEKLLDRASGSTGLLGFKSKHLRFVPHEQVQATTEELRRGKPERTGDLTDNVQNWVIRTLALDRLRSFFFFLQRIAVYYIYLYIFLPSPPTHFFAALVIIHIFIPL